MVYQQKTHNSLRSSGMSIIEISIVIMIIGIFAAATVGMFRWVGTARIKTTQSRLQSLSSAIEMYKADGRQLPSRLEDLLKKPADWKQGYYNPDGYVKNDSELEDSWGNAFIYKRNATGTGSGKRPYELYSWGPNGEGSPQEEWLHIWDI